MTTPPKQNYQHLGLYDRVIFQDGVTTSFRRSGRFNAAAVPDMLNLLGMIERDPGINDVRQAAYMLATVMWETTSPTTVTSPAVNKKGVALVDKHNRPIMVKRRRWLMTMAPVNEVGHGKGRRYHEPVKIKTLSDDKVRVTEQDGDQFVVLSNGRISALTANARMDTADGSAASSVYDKDDGVERAYYGRGYVQLTWWSNYALAGVALGQGLNLLKDPELVATATVAYALMSHGMRTGSGFANGRSFSQYFNSGSSNYRAERSMVNGSDHAADIAAIAVEFEGILLKARVTNAKPSAASGQRP